MKSINRTFIAPALLVAGVLTNASGSCASELAAVASNQRLSVTQGFSSASLASLTRESGKDAEQVAAELVGKLRPGASLQKTVANGGLHFAGENFALDLSQDGSAGEFRDLAVAARAHSLGLPLSQKVSARVLEEKGRAFIAAHLASEITLAPGEQLVALRADYRTEGGQDLATGKTTEAVTGSRIVFGRSIGGTPVVGNGSKVIVTFTNDGAVESFHYDWPIYSTGAPESVITPAEALSRVQSVMSVRAGVSAGKTVAASAGNGSVYPLEIAPNTQLEALECGYYDAGVKSTMTQSVEPGCTYRVVLQDRLGTRTAFAGAVPAGALITADRGWLETQILTGK